MLIPPPDGEVAVGPGFGEVGDSSALDGATDPSTGSVTGGSSVVTAGEVGEGATTGGVGEGAAATVVGITISSVGGRIRGKCQSVTAVGSAAYYI